MIITFKKCQCYQEDQKLKTAYGRDNIKQTKVPHFHCGSFKKMKSEYVYSLIIFLKYFMFSKYLLNDDMLMIRIP